MMKRRATIREVDAFQHHGSLLKTPSNLCIIIVPRYCNLQGAICRVALDVETYK